MVRKLFDSYASKNFLSAALVALLLALAITPAAAEEPQVVGESMSLPVPPETTIPQAIVDETLLSTGYTETEAESASIAEAQAPDATAAICVQAGCYATIQGAISAARSGETVSVPAGTYVEALQMRVGVSVIGASATTTIVRAPAGATRVVNFSAATTSSTVLANLTIDANRTAGGIVVGAGSPTIRNNIIINGRATYGAGILVSNSGTAPTISANEIRGNVAGNSGGGLLIQSSSRPTVSGNTFLNNSAPQQGGAIVVSTSATPNISGNTFRGNSAMQGGALAASGSGAWSFSNNQVLSNTTSGSQSSGGGLYIFKSAVSVLGNTFDSNVGGIDAGAILMNNGGTATIFINTSVVVDGNTFTNNSASRSAGALFLVSGASPTIRDNTFRRNRTTTEGGGAINYVDQADGVLENNLMEDNSAAFGGGLYIDGFSDPVVQNNRILNNRSQSAGGVQINNNSRPTFTRNTVSGNVASTQVGGMWVSVNSVPLISSNTFSNNSGGQIGGGLALLTAGNTVVINNSFTGNTANMGAGIYINQSSPVIERNTITGNTASSFGGGVTYSTSGGRFENNIVAGNSGPAGAGAGMALYRGSPTIQNNTIVDNTPGEAINAWTNASDPAATAIVRSNIIVGHGIALRSAGNQTLSSSYNTLWSNSTAYSAVAANSTDLTQDPRFRNRAARDFGLVSGSPAIDRADPSVSPAVDFSGAARPVDGDGRNGPQPDMGAFEAPAGTGNNPGTFEVYAAVGETTNRTNYLTIFNASAGNASVSVQFVKADGSTVNWGPVTLAANQRQRLHVNAIGGMGATAYSTIIQSTAAGVVGQIEMFWKDYRDVSGSSTLGKGSYGLPTVGEGYGQQYFASGFFRENWDNRFAVFNPSASQTASVTFTFIGTNGATHTHTLSVAPRRRAQIVMDTTITALNLVDYSTQVNSTVPVVVELETMFTRRGATGLGSGGMAVRGVPQGQTTNIFPAGYNHYDPNNAGYQMWINYLHLYNPGSTAASVTIQYTYQKTTMAREGAGTGGTFSKTYTVQPGKRLSFWTADAAAGGDSRLADADYSVLATSNVPIVAQMNYFYDRYSFAPGQTGSDGFTLTGASGGATRQAIPHGFTGGASDWTNYFKLYNPNTTAVTVTITHYREGEAAVSYTRSIPARGLANFKVDDVGGMAGKNYATVVSSPQPVVAELGLYSNDFGGSLAGASGGYVMRAQPVP